MSTHTPGPWIEKNGHIYHEATKPYVFTNLGGKDVDTDSGLIALVYGTWEKDHSIPEGSQVANRRLISAAPEMLSALRNIEEVLGRMAEQNPAMNMFPLVEARAAILKAKGQS